jgi:hypothetical protein
MDVPFFSRYHRNTHPGDGGELSNCLIDKKIRHLTNKAAIPPTCTFPSLISIPFKPDEDSFLNLNGSGLLTD